MTKQPQSQQVYLFKDEMKFFLQHWKLTKENANQWWKADIDESQLNAYPNNRKLTQDQLGVQEDSEKLDLIVVNPRTNELENVGSGSASLARKYFEDNENMRWPPYEDVVRMGLFFHWGYYRIASMLLKVHWEKYLKSKAWGVMKYDQCEGLSDFLKNSTKAIEQFSLSFFEEACTAEIIESWYSEMRYYGLEEYDEEKFQMLIQEYCNNQLFLRSVNDPFWDGFIADKKKEKEQATQEYWTYKTIWATREGALEQAIYDYGQAKLNYRFLTNKWYNQFGAEYMRSRKLLFSNKILQNRILLKTENPDMDDEQLAREEQNDLYSYKNEIDKHAQLTKEAESFQEAEKVLVTNQFANDYHQACKKLLKRIWLLTHPDSYQTEGFTDKQIEILDEKFEQSLEINERIANDGSDNFDLLELQNLLSEVENIWETIGKEIPDYDAVIGKETDDKVAWLKNRIPFLENQIEQMQLRVKSVETNADYLEKKETLASESNMEQTHKAFAERIKTLEELHEELKDQCEKLAISTEVDFQW